MASPLVASRLPMPYICRFCRDLQPRIPKPAGRVGSRIEWLSSSNFPSACLRSKRQYSQLRKTEQPIGREDPSAGYHREAAWERAAWHARGGKGIPWLQIPSNQPLSPEQQLQVIIQETNKLIDLFPIPKEELVLKALRSMQALTERLQRDTSASFPPQPNSLSATEAILGSLATEEPKASTSVAYTEGTERKSDAIKRLTALAFRLVRHKNVFISPAILKEYTHLQISMESPSSLPEVFHLYAHKPLPRPSSRGSSTITYSNPWSRSPKNAIPPSLASSALDIAIQHRNLPLAQDVIETTYSTPSHRRSKVLRQASFPLAGLALSPLAAYTLATQIAPHMPNLDPQSATLISFLGILSYIGFTATLGIVAVTTSNDQMRRVTWVVGTPLRERWMREDERAAVERVAFAWGFQSEMKWGEEAGEQWDEIREWVGNKGMVLDRVASMEGME